VGNAADISEVRAGSISGLKPCLKIEAAHTSQNELDFLLIDPNEIKTFNEWEFHRFMYYFTGLLYD
jgi:hypothetical protein